MIVYLVISSILSSIRARLGKIREENSPNAGISCYPNQPNSHDHDRACSPKLDLTDLIHQLLSIIPHSHAMLSLVNQLLFIHSPSSSLLPACKQLLVNMYVENLSPSHCMSEENQTEEKLIVSTVGFSQSTFYCNPHPHRDQSDDWNDDRSDCADEEKEWLAGACNGSGGKRTGNEKKENWSSEKRNSLYSHFLQIISTHFEALFPNMDDTMNAILSLGHISTNLPLLSKSLKAVEHMVNEDLLHCLCENQYLIGKLSKQWIPQAERLVWNVVTPSAPEGGNEGQESFQFDRELSSDGIVIDLMDQSATNVNPYHRKQNIAVIAPAVARGCVECVFKLEEDRPGDEMVCFGVCSWPLESIDYEKSPSMWL